MMIFCMCVHLFDWYEVETYMYMYVLWYNMPVVALYKLPYKQACW